MEINNEYISICITLKNRSKLLDEKLHQLQFQKYDLKKVEICITDGGSDNNLFKVLERWSNSFYQIKYAFSDRSVLPFKVLVNPACDYNAQMVNQTTFEKIIRTDAEVLFTDSNQLQNIAESLNDKDVCIWHPSIIIEHEGIFSYKGKDPFHIPSVTRYGGRNAFCIGINKSTFIKNKGFDERYAIGFAGEDNQLLRWYGRNKKEIKACLPVIHQWHIPPVANPEYRMLRDTYTKPLLKRMTEENEGANLQDSNNKWKRPEMLSQETTYKNVKEKTNYCSLSC